MSFKTAFLVTVAITSTSPLAQESPSARHQPAVVEFFTSQSCSSCVPATQHFNELAVRDDVVALSWHVDYWNTLFTKQGRWVDPYSDAAHTERQRAYNENIRHRRSVYTPQFVIGGLTEFQGTDRDRIVAAINLAEAERPASSISISLTNGETQFDISENSGGNAYLIFFDKSTRTEIARGENAGRTINGRNVVTNVKKLGVLRRIGGRYSVPLTTDQIGCALLIQEPRQGRIIDAAYCASS